MRPRCSGRSPARTSFRAEPRRPCAAALDASFAQPPGICRDEAGTVREIAPVMQESTITEPTKAPQARTLSWMASMSAAAGEMRAAEGYLLELLAWCAFTERDVPADA